MPWAPTILSECARKKSFSRNRPLQEGGFFMGPAQAGVSKTQKKRSAVKRAPCGKQTFLFEVPRTQFLL